jgi:ParB family chromosome partitioning protein
MAVAGRDSAEALTRLAEEQAEARRRNADEAEAYRAADKDGRLLRRIPIAAVRTDTLPRDRMALEAVSQSPEMEELKASIRARGQREAIEVWVVGEERLAAEFNLKTGWRRLEALRQLHAETGEERFATVLARVTLGAQEREGHYVAMVEENAIREDISFAEMAHVAIQMASDPLTPVADADEAVDRLYASLHKVKRSNIRRFVDLLQAVGDLLASPRDVPKNLGAEVARAIHKDDAALEVLRAALRGVTDAASQNAALMAFLARGADATAVEGEVMPARRASAGRRKFEFHVGGLKVTARSGELRLRGEADFTEVSRERLEAAIAAFSAALDG